MALFEFSLKSSRGIEKQIRRDSGKLRKLEGEINNLKKRLEEAAKKGDVKEVYNDVQKLIQDHRDEINYLIEIMRDDEIVIHRIIESMHELDQKMLELEKEGYPKEIAEKLRNELSKADNEFASNLRAQRRYAKIQYKEAV